MDTRTPQDNTEIEIARACDQAVASHRAAQQPPDEQLSEDEERALDLLLRQIEAHFARKP